MPRVEPLIVPGDEGSPASLAPQQRALDEPSAAGAHLAGLGDQNAGNLLAGRAVEMNPVLEEAVSAVALAQVDAAPSEGQFVICAVWPCLTVLQTMNLLSTSTSLPNFLTSPMREVSLLCLPPILVANIF